MASDSKQVNGLYAQTNLNSSPLEDNESVTGSEYNEEDDS